MSTGSYLENGPGRPPEALRGRIRKASPRLRRNSRPWARVCTLLVRCVRVLTANKNTSKTGFRRMAARSLARAGFLRVTVLGDWGESSIWVPMLSRNSKMSVRRMPRLPLPFSIATEHVCRPRALVSGTRPTRIVISCLQICCIS